MLAIGTDAHAAAHLSDAEPHEGKVGGGTARRGWCGSADVLNARCLGDVLAWLKRPA
jgi:histidinol phosphatase-like PHP family hydrolase